MNRKWEVYEVEEDKVEQLSRKYNISKLVAKILVNKNIISDKDVNIFLNPSRHDFYDPFLMPDMGKAVDRILQAINNKEKIVIFGDYDVDGITSTTVLKRFLLERGVDVSQYIPNRLFEGYGLNKDAIKDISDKDYKLMITVDCGISAIEEVEYANSLGMETIITDHHEPGDILPNALAVVDAKRKDNTYPFNQLAGVGVAFKLIQAISISLKLEEKEYLKYLDLVCVGTISDIVPLIDENRTIAKLGLKLVQVTKNIGLKTLIDASGYNKIDSTTISFGISPRINACGRMGHADDALKLFLTEDIQEAKQIAQKLNEYNRERQEIEKRIFDEAIEQIQNNKAEKDVIVLGSENWHHGVIGIVSSKITEMYFKPSILICFEEETGKGSGRSIPGFDLYEALSKCNKHITRFGGHSMAIGITIEKQQFENFKKDFEEYAHNCNISDIIPIISIDEAISLKEISIRDVAELKLLEPYGEANKMPLFLCKNLKIQSIRALSEGKHLKLSLKDDNYWLDAIGFNLGYLSEDFKIGDKVDIVGTLEINQYKGRENIQVNLKDIRKSY